MRDLFLIGPTYRVNKAAKQIKKERRKLESLIKRWEKKYGKL